MDIIVSLLSGSRAYGVHNEDSDIDIRGVYVTPMREKLSPWSGSSSHKGEGEDTVYYELSKYLQLLAAQNPNVMEYIWTDKSDIQHMEPEWKILQDARYDMLSKKAKGKYLGFANRTRGRMLKYESWEQKPPVKPLPKDFIRVSANISLPSRHMPDIPSILVQKGQDFALYEYPHGHWHDGHGNLRILKDKDIILPERPLAYCSFNSTDYEKQKSLYRSYVEWMQNRNTGNLYERLGYDTKQAYHLIRILRQGTEILKKGILHVKRPDAQQLRDIREGQYSLDDIMSLAVEEENNLLAAYEKTPLPDDVNHDIVMDICDRIYKGRWDAHKIKHNNDRIICMDIEATGTNGPGYNITELAMIEMIGGKKTGRVWHSWFCPDESPTDYVSNLTGLDMDFLKNKPRFENCADDILEFIGDAPIIAHNAPCDRRFLAHDMKLASKTPPEKFICSQKLAKQLFGRKNLGLNDICEIMDIDTQQRKKHGAMIDTELLTDAIEKMTLLPEYTNMNDAKINDVDMLSRQDRREWNEEQRANKIKVDGHDIHYDVDGEREVINIDFPDGYIMTRRGNNVIVSQEGIRKPSNPIGPSIIQFPSLKRLYECDGHFVEKENDQMNLSP